MAQPRVHVTSIGSSLQDPSIWPTCITMCQYKTADRWARILCCETLVWGSFRSYCGKSDLGRHVHVPTWCWGSLVYQDLGQEAQDPLACLCMNLGFLNIIEYTIGLFVYEIYVLYLGDLA